MTLFSNKSGQNPCFVNPCEGGCLETLPMKSLKTHFLSFFICICLANFLFAYSIFFYLTRTPVSVTCLLLYSCACNSITCDDFHTTERAHKVIQR